MADLPWTNGFPPEKSLDEWAPALMRVLQHTFEDDVRKPSTSAAEMGLGLPPSVYWYIGSCHANFAGHAVALWQVGPTAGLDGGICPFDSGGLWHRYIHTDPPLNSAGEVVDYFVMSDRPLEDWPLPVSAEVRQCYDDFVADYVLAPKPPDRRPTARVHLPAPHQDPRAWLWEARIAVSDAGRAPLNLRWFYWRQEDSNLFTRWVKTDDRFSTDEALALLRAANRLGRIVDVPIIELKQDLVAMAA